MISEKMYANHRAQNFLMSEKKRHRDEKFMGIRDREIP